MKKLFTYLGMMILACSFCNGVASAHVTVQPEETTQGSYEIFTVRVPSENNDFPTTQVKVEFSEEVYISRFEPKPGWKYEIQKDDTGKMASVTWIAENDGLSTTEFALFNMQGRVVDDATEIIWKAYQTYQDGSVVEWVGAEDSQKPASVTKVNPKLATSSGDHHAATKPTEPIEKDTVQSNEEKKQTTNSLYVALYISIAALMVGVISLSISRKKRL